MQTTVNNLKDLFMGNPGALQQTMQREQQAKPGVPPDLLKMIALQEITEQHQAAQRDAAMRNNAQNQPTVADSLRQRAQQVLMAKQVQAQQQQMAKAGQIGLPQGLPQPQRQPEMGLDQIQSNLGEYYGGGIVAFNGEEDSFVGDPMLGTMVAKNELGGDDRTLFERLGVFNPENRKALEAMDRKIAANKSVPQQDLVQLSATKPPAITDQEYQNALKILQSPTNKASFAKEINSRTDLLPEEKKSMIERYDNGWAQWEKVKRQWEAENPPQPKPSAPKPSAQKSPGLPGSPRVQPNVEQAPVAPVAQEPQDPLTAALERQILGNLSVDKDAKARARRTETERYLGLDTLAAGQRERAQKEYDMQKQQAQGRNPFSAFTAGINPNARTLAEGLRGGQQTLAAATAGWDKSDFEALQNYNKALSGIDTQTVAGKKFALEAEDTLFKDLSADARNSLTSGTSMINTRENAAARKQAALDARLGREAAAREGRLGREAAAKIAADRKIEDAADKQDARYREQAMRLAVAAATKEKALPQNITKLKNTGVDELAATMFDRYYQMLKSGKMPESPGAQSPGASAPSGWGNAQVVKQ
jgi:hypothetical protein